MAIKVLFFSIFFLLFLSYVAVSDSLENSPSVADSESVDCVYTAYIRTGSVLKAGTDSVISVRLSDAYGDYVEISNLEAWGGLMGPGYNYFERRNLDIFSGRGKCLSGYVCAMNLTSDGSGPNSQWYVNYVEVTHTGVHTVCAQELFTVEQWLGLDTVPFTLTTSRNYCSVPSEHRAKVIKSAASEM